MDGEIDVSIDRQRNLLIKNGKYIELNIDFNIVLKYFS